jgi:hypothetical protein
MQLTFKGRVFATPSAVTIVQNGTEIFSGQVGTGQPLDTELNLFQSTVPAPVGTTTATYSVSMSVTSGVITCGDTLVQYDDSETYVMVPGEGPDLRANILINGQPPEWPSTPIDTMPGGTEGAPNWQGWFFELAAGESITYTYTVPGGPAPA